MLKVKYLVLIAPILAVALLASQPAAAQGASELQEMRNKPVTLELSNTPVRAAIEALFKFVTFNHVVGTNVDGFISISLTDVPFEQALRAITRINEPRLTYRREDNIYYIDVQKTEVDMATQIQPTEQYEEEIIEEPRLRPQKIQLNFGRVDLISQLFPGKVTVVREEDEDTGYGGGGYGGMGGGMMGGGYGGLGGGMMGGYGGIGGGYGGIGGGYGGIGGGYGGIGGGYGGIGGGGYGSRIGGF